MAVLCSIEIPLVLEMVPWKNYSGKRVMDVGGGHGAVMGAVKNDFPEVQTLSFDMPRVIESAAGVPPGVEMIAGDMFDVSSYPNKLDAIFMKHILHDWDDESCISILKACHGALNVGSKVFVADAIVPGPGETSATRLARFQLQRHNFLSSPRVWIVNMYRYVLYKCLPLLFLISFRCFRTNIYTITTIGYDQRLQPVSTFIDCYSAVPSLLGLLGHFEDASALGYFDDVAFRRQGKNSGAVAIPG